MCTARILILASTVVGCTGTIKERMVSSEQEPMGGNSGTGGSTGTGGTGGHQSGGTGGTGGAGAMGGSGGMGGSIVSPPPPPPVCTGNEIAVGASPLRRLTRREYNNSVRDLLGSGIAPTLNIEDESSGGFYANGTSAISDGHLARYVDSAETISAAFIRGPLSESLTCDKTKIDCVRPYLENLVQRAYRRPVSRTETDAIVHIYQNAVNQQWTADKGIELALQAILLSPNFLYHVEVGTAEAGNGPRPLSPFELASRLSYFLWQSLPDATLSAAAQNGGLDEKGIESQIARMLQDPKSDEGLGAFYDQWMGLDHLDEASRSTAYAGWGPELVRDLRKETSDFVGHLLREGDGSLRTLLTASYSFVTPRVAPLYGVTVPGNGGRVELDPAQRSGILTHAGFLAAAGDEDTKVIFRGKFVFERLLCQTMPPPIDDTIPGVDRVKDASCAGCHLATDPIGFGFDSYDTVGRYRVGHANREANIFVAPAEAAELKGRFTDAVDLGKKLASSKYVEECVAKQWFRYAVRRSESSNDACSMQRGKEAFAGGDIRKLIAALATSDAFRNLPAQGN